MTWTVMVYGADQFMGELIVDRLLGLAAPGVTVVLSGLDTARLTELGTARNLEIRPFDWNDEGAAVAELAGVDLVVNAATPFEKTVELLGQAAVEAGCHYVDANTELDAEIGLSLLDGDAALANVTLANAAGPTAALTDMLVDAALSRLVLGGTIGPNRRIGAIRIAVSCLSGFSRSSAQSAYRAITRAVLVLKVEPRPAGLEIELESQPIGQRERSFNFAPAQAPAKPTICAAANLTDAFAAARVAKRHAQTVGSIECFVAMNEVSRLTYPLAAAIHTATGPAWLYGLASVVDSSFGLLPQGPMKTFREAEPFTLLLTIEDEFKVTLVDWRLSVPSFYDTGATVVAGLVQQVLSVSQRGVVTPSIVNIAQLNADPITLPLATGVTLERRVFA